MVFQDGAGARQYVTPVFDNLIAKGDIPVMVGIFIEPGGIKAPRDNRSFEYDTLSDQYARFLLEEILPEVEKTTRLRRDAAGRGIAGQSSGAIAAFTAAWERPAEFSKVLSGIGSFTNIAAGKTLREGRTQLRSARPARAPQADQDLHAGRRQRSGQRVRQLVAGQSDAGHDRSRSPATITSSSRASGSTTTTTCARSCPMRCGGYGGTKTRDLDDLIDEILDLDAVAGLERLGGECLGADARGIELLGRIVDMREDNLPR